MIQRQLSSVGFVRSEWQELYDLNAAYDNEAGYYNSNDELERHGDGSNVLTGMAKDGMLFPQGR